MGETLKCLICYRCKQPWVDGACGCADGCCVVWGDCRDALPLIPNGSIDLVLTDPPYLFKHIDGGGFASASRFYRDGALKGLTDFKLKEYQDILGVAPQLVAFHSRDQIREYAEFIYAKWGKYDLHIWYKPNAIPFTHNTWKSDIEYIALGWATKCHAAMPQELKSKAWIAPIEVGQSHPAQKPVQLLSKYIRVLQPQIVLDPFLGSGTTAVACKLLGRRCLGIEISEEYCQIACRRLDATTPPLPGLTDPKPEQASLLW